MPHEHLYAYLESVRSLLTGLRGCWVEEYTDQVFSSGRAIISCRVRFPEGKLLHVNECVRIGSEQLERVDYRYHFQGPKGELIFRFDSTRHFPDLPFFPFHKHTADGVTGHPRPELASVLEQASQASRP
jgi:hypothetical protein